VTDGLAGLEVGGEELLGELVRRARTSAGQQWFAAAGNAVVLGSNKATPLLRTPRSRDNPYHPAWKPPLDEADIQQLALAIGQQVSTAYFAGTSRGRSEILAEGHEIRLQDEGGRIVAALPAPRQLRFSEQDGETLVERYVTLDGGPIEGEIGEWREPPDDQEGQ
jgi:hypothetical protein